MSRGSRRIGERFKRDLGLRLWVRVDQSGPDRSKSTDFGAQSTGIQGRFEVSDPCIEVGLAMLQRLDLGIETSNLSFESTILTLEFGNMVCPAF